MITAAQTRQTTFATTRFAAAYDRASVDRLLQGVARTLDALERGSTVGPDGAPLLLPRDVRTATLPPSGAAEGYLATEVEAFRAQLVATLEEYVRRFSAVAPAVPAAPATPASRAVPAHRPASSDPGQVWTGAPPGRPVELRPPAGGHPDDRTDPARTAPRPGGSGSAPPRPAPAAVDLTDAPDGLGAYDVLVQVQQARATLFGAARDALVVRRPDGTELRVTSVEVVPGGAVVHAR